MKVVWDLGPCTVRNVYETLRTRRQIAHSTVMTTMRILERKGQLKVSRKDRAFVYRPARPVHASGSSPRWSRNSVFGGAAEPLVQHLVRDRHLTKDDLREIALAILRVKEPA